ncbi:C5a anaphylatoxin chemotactic receptor 1-like [Amphiura filiformis]|uniref:C5a anaphylatoxin chemotactic receptor 1-like n=1 Tax=Amphiura filiformis TaxID=82378 RepID=UPI003B225E0A
MGFGYKINGTMEADYMNYTNSTGEYTDAIIMEPHHIANIIFGTLIIMLGVPGNLLVIRVYSVKRLPNSTTILIIALSVTDLIVCILQPVIIYRNSPFGEKAADKSEFFCRFPPILTFLMVYTAAFITTAIAVDRYFAVCKPLKRIMTPKKAICVVICCFVFSLTIAVPRLALVRRLALEESSYKCVTNKTLDSVTIVPYYLAIFISFICIAVLYVIVVLAIRKQVKIRPGQHERNLQVGERTRAERHNQANSTEITRENQKSETVKNRGQDLQSKTTKMLLLATIAIFLTLLPTAIFHAISDKYLEYIRYTRPGAYVVLTIMRDIHLLNNATNPLIYSLVNERFRKDCRRMLKV